MDPKDNTPAAGGQDGGNGNGNPTNGEARTPAEAGKEGTPKTFSQEEVNAIVAREKREHSDKIAKFKAAGLSDEQISVLEKKEEVNGSAEDLTRVRQERVALILDKNKDLVEKMDPTYLEKLKNASPEDVETVVTNTRKMIADIEGENKPQGQGGNMPSFEEGKLPAGVAPKDQALIEGIQNFEKTGDPSQMVQGLIQSWDVKL